MMTRKAGNASVKSVKSIFTTFFIISPPIIMRIGVMAASGTSLINGMKKRDSRRSEPVITEVNPVLPPVVIPAAVSTVETAGLVPNNPQTMVEIEMAFKDFPLFSGAPSIPFTWEWTSPIFSKTSTNTNEKTADQNGRKDHFPKWLLRKTSL